MGYRLGVDIGGTFTDFALLHDESGRLTVYKQLTTPHDPAEAVLEGLQVMLARDGVDIAQLESVIHGTTLVTNAVIERKGAKTGMLVSEGFRDVLDIAMERRYDLFDLRLVFAEPVVPRSLRREVAERLGYDGEVMRPLDPDTAVVAARELVEGEGIEALAICFLHSYSDDTHEAAARDAVQAAFPGLFVTTSSDVLPFMREYERWSTTTINAYVQPLTNLYLGHLEEGLAALGFAGSFLIMTSSGGTVTAETARRFPVRLIESGPAAGALMAALLGEMLGEPELLSFDMGGTTAKGALIREGAPLRKYELEVAREHDFKAGSGLPLRIPVIDMIEIGAGGGSIASVDERRLLAVGPRSAGADPGPACYGRGGKSATLTDADLALGYLVPEQFLGGRMALDTSAAGVALETEVGGPLDVTTTRAAWGIHEVVNEDVARAFREHASEIGFDYRRSAMVAFGGSGPMHALRIARKLRIPKVIFPAGAGVMSAIGLLATPLTFASLRSHRARLARVGPAELAEGFAPLLGQARAQLSAAGVASGEIALTRRLDMRYVGQGYEVEVELPEGRDDVDVVAQLAALFQASYEAVFATSFLDNEVEIVNWKIEARGPRPDLARGYRPPHPPRGAEAELARARAYDPEAEAYVDCPVLDRYALEAGAIVDGPALIQEDESTSVLGPGERATVDAYGNLIAELAGE